MVNSRRLPVPANRLADQASWSMFVAAHRAHSPRKRRCAPRDRVLIFAVDPEVRRWIEHELFGECATTEHVGSLAEVVASLTLIPPPWPQFLILEAATLSRSDVDVLGAIRYAGWPGMVIAIGDVPDDVHRSLGIDRVLPRALGSEVLRNALRQVGIERPTTPMRRIVP
jgi:hypothetical protein